MSLRKLTYLFTVLSLALLFAPIIVQADTAVHLDGDPNDGCAGSWVFPPLYVGGEDGVVFAQAAYEFDENCSPILVNAVRLNYIPASASEDGPKPFQIKTVPIAPPPPPEGGGSRIEVVDTCHLRTWEEDAPGFGMIAVQVDQTYSWNGSTVTLSNGSVSATTYFSWWYIGSGPSGVAGYHNTQVWK